MSPKVSNEESYVLYQHLCDEVFGDGSVVIKPSSSNNVIGTLRYLEDYIEFKKNFKNRLIRLRDHFKGTPSYTTLLEQVKLIADPKNWEGAYAELAAYDILWNDMIGSPIELDNTLDKSESYSLELGMSETNEDGFLYDYDLYFDVKILADTVGAILNGIIHDALQSLPKKVVCNILPEYPLDDNDEEYGGKNRKLLLDELKEFLTSNIIGVSGNKKFRSNIIHRLSYNIHWGGGVNTAISEYNPYRHAEETKHLILKRYTKKIMKNKRFVLVLVNFPWYNGRISSFMNADQIYYRCLARRTFCAYINDTTQLKSIVPKFKGSDTIFEVSKHLAGIIFIDDHIIKKDAYSCNVIMNPNNAFNKRNTLLSDYFMSIVSNGDNRSLYDDLMYDNY